MGKAQEKLEQAAKGRLDRARKMRDFFNTPGGKLVWENLMALYDQPINPMADDMTDLQMAFLSGQRDVARQFKELIDLAGGLQSGGEYSGNVFGDKPLSHGGVVIKGD